MKKIILIFSAILLLSSCIGVKSNISINADNSGILVFEYRISQMFANMGNPEQENGSSDPPLPISKENLAASVEGIEGLELRNVTHEENETDIIITAEIMFDSIDALAKSSLFESMPISYQKIGEDNIFKQQISEASEEEVDEESIQMIEGLFTGYEMIFTVNTPTQIKEYSVEEYSLGELSAENKTATYRISIAELMKLREKTELIIKW